MLTLKSKLAIMTALSFLCALIFTIPVSAQSGSGGVVDLKGTGSTGSFSYDDQGQGSSIGHGAKQQRSEGSKSKFSSHGSKGYSGHISGSDSHKKSEGSKSKSYSHGKPGHGKSSHAYKGAYGKSYGHKKGSHGGHGGHGQSPFKHVMHYKNKLGLTDTQIQTMKELDADFKKKIIQAKADHQIAHVELDLRVHSGKVDEAKIRDAGAKIVASKTSKIMAMIDAKIQLLNLLTVEQRQKMAKMH